MKMGITCQPYKTNIRPGAEKIDTTIRNQRQKKIQTWKNKPIFATLHDQPVTWTAKKSWLNKNRNLKSDCLKCRPQKARMENQLHLKRRLEYFTKKLCAQRTALAAWWESQPTKRKKAPRRDGGFFAARTTKSACTHCWAHYSALGNLSSRMSGLQAQTKRTSKTIRLRLNPFCI